MIYHASAQTLCTLAFSIWSIAPATCQTNHLPIHVFLMRQNWVCINIDFCKITYVDVARNIIRRYLANSDLTVESLIASFFKIIFSRNTSFISEFKPWIVSYYKNAYRSQIGWLTLELTYTINISNTGNAVLIISLCSELTRILAKEYLKLQRAAMQR